MNNLTRLFNTDLTFRELVSYAYLACETAGNEGELVEKAAAWLAADAPDYESEGYVDVSIEACDDGEEPSVELVYDDDDVHDAPAKPAAAPTQKRMPAWPIAVAVATCFTAILIALPFAIAGMSTLTMQDTVVAARAEAVSDTDDGVEPGMLSRAYQERAEHTEGAEADTPADDADPQPPREDNPDAASPSLADMVRDIADAADKASRPRHELACASHEWHSQAAIDAGGIVEYEDGYYCAHDYDEGARFFEFQIGDIVAIDGFEIEIEGVHYTNYWTDTVDALRDRLGRDKVLFQTCMPQGGGDVCVWYGSRAA